MGTSRRSTPLTATLSQGEREPEKPGTPESVVAPPGQGESGPGDRELTPARINLQSRSKLPHSQVPTSSPLEFSSLGRKTRFATIERS